LPAHGGGSSRVTTVNAFDLVVAVTAVDHVIACRGIQINHIVPVSSIYPAAKNICSDENIIVPVVAEDSVICTRRGVNDVMALATDDIGSPASVVIVI
jgi:hypothetical protein